MKLVVVVVVLVVVLVVTTSIPNLIMNELYNLFVIHFRIITFFFKKKTKQNKENTFKTIYDLEKS